MLITPTSVVQYTPRWIGRQEESIHMAHIASVKIDTGVLLSDVLIETSGGANPIRCHGHRKGDAVADEDAHRAAIRTTTTASGSRPASPVGPASQPSR